MPIDGLVQRGNFSLPTTTQNSHPRQDKCDRRHNHNHPLSLSPLLPAQNGFFKTTATVCTLPPSIHPSINIVFRFWKGLP